MTTSTELQGRYAEAAVVEAARGRGEPEWLLERRAEAARAFAATPLPTRQLRPWKYTDVSALDFAGFAAGGARLTVEANPPTGSAAGSLAEALAAMPEDLRAHLGNAIPAAAGKFT